MAEGIKSPEPKVRCAFCDQLFSRRAMTRHLKSCAARRQAIADEARSGKVSEPIYHVRVTDRHGGPWLLHLEVRGTAHLSDLDDYLRAIWLECCGHLSQFDIDGIEYGAFPDRSGFGPLQRSQKVAIARVLKPAQTFTFVYDYGTTSELSLKVVEVREGLWPHRYPIRLLARNEPPDWHCHECGEAAELVCTTCLWEAWPQALVCEQHIEAHRTRFHADDEYWEDYLLPVVNSPRMGLCGYDGPAEPPY